MAPRQRTNGAPGWREMRRHRIARQRQAWGRDDDYDEDEDDDRAPRRTRGNKRRSGARRGSTSKQPLLRYDRAPLCLIGFAVLALWWAIGGRYTIDGMPLLGNAILAFFRASPAFGPIVDPQWYLKLCWLPVAISIVERRNRPRLRMDWNITIVYAMLIWLIVTGADFGSTWLAVTHPDADAWPLARQVAKIPLLALLWTTATTFGPEIGFAALWKYMRG